MRDAITTDGVKLEQARSGSQSPSLLRRMPSFLSRLAAAEKREHSKTATIIPASLEQQYLDDLQVKANALFRRSLPKHMQPSGFDKLPPTLQPLPKHGMMDDDGDEATLSPTSTSSPPLSDTKRPRSPIRRAAGLAHRGITATVRTARTHTSTA